MCALIGQKPMFYLTISSCVSVHTVCRDNEHAGSLESTKEVKELHSAAPCATLASC